MSEPSALATVPAQEAHLGPGLLCGRPDCIHKIHSAHGQGSLHLILHTHTIKVTPSMRKVWHKISMIITASIISLSAINTKEASQHSIHMRDAKLHSIRDKLAPFGPANAARAITPCSTAELSRLALPTYKEQVPAP